MWATIINAIQASSLEHKGMRTAPWNGSIGVSSISKKIKSFLRCLWIINAIYSFAVGLLFAYTVAMFILYSVAPILYRLSSSVYYNLSLLSSDFYGLLFGLFLFVSLASHNMHLIHC